MKRLLPLYLLVLLHCSSAKKASETATYKEPHRPQLHFSPPNGWMNDPNGLVYYKGEYHMFYQHYPHDIVWGPMHWGHAVSTDLVHWKNLPIALYPDTIGCIFSGSAVLDALNTTGFAPKGSTEQPMVAIFTYHNLDWERAGRLDRESQGIAYSLDKGRTWTKYAGNPVIKNKGDVNFRDPKVFWHQATQHWIMPLAVGDHLEIFTSKDLKTWVKAGDFGKNEGSHGGVWECPDLFPLKTEDGKEKWVLVQNMDRGAVNGGSGTQYFVGSFDGKTFKNDNPPSTVLWLDYGVDNYAGVTWFNAPDQRRIFIGWMSNWDDYAQKVPTQKWRSAMTVPRDFSLYKNKDGAYRLRQLPVPELQALRKKHVPIADQSLNGNLDFAQSTPLKELDLHFDLKNAGAKQVGFTLSNSKGEKVVVAYDPARKEMSIDRTQSGIIDFSKIFPKKHSGPIDAGDQLHIRAIIDVASVELFINDGKLAMTEIFFPNEDFGRLSLFAEGGTAHLMPSSLWELSRIW